MGKTAVIGIACAVTSLACFAIGVAFGWNARSSVGKPASAACEPDVRDAAKEAEDVRRAQRQDDMRRMDEAFEALQQYSAETAYGMGGGSGIGMS